jgi:hypothetical protein
MSGYYRNIAVLDACVLYRVEINFGTGDPSIHTFPLTGFAEASTALSGCYKGVKQ